MKLHAENGPQGPDLQPAPATVRHAFAGVAREVAQPVGLVERVSVERGLALLRTGGALERSIVFGSFGLALHGARTFEAVPDLDVIASLDDTVNIARALLAQGALVTSWNEAVDATWTRAQLEGRIYVRAHVDGALIVDVTYEGVDVAAFRADAHVIDGAHVATLARIEERRALRSS